MKKININIKTTKKTKHLDANYTVNVYVQTQKLTKST
jgi:hypothetical protein